MARRLLLGGFSDPGTGLSGVSDDADPPTNEATNLELDLLREHSDQLILDLTEDRASIRFRQKALDLDESPLTPAERLVIRAFDLVIASVLAVLLSPVYLLVAMTVLATSRGPILFGSQRIGQDGQPFTAWKFRSMVVDAEAQLESHLEANPAAKAEYQRSHKLKRDPRTTTIGGALRKTSLDELPQLFNVIRGEMSLVGPRPKLLSEGDRFGATLPTVLRVKPGITGLWQVSGRSNLSFEERIFLDVEYATNRSIRTDIGICITTAKQALQPSKHGAF